LLDGVYDLVILVSSWEDRVRAVTEADKLRCTLGLLVQYEEQDGEGARAKNDELLVPYIEKISDSTAILNSSATDLDGTWGNLFAHLVRHRARIGRPLSVLLDASTCQRYHILALLARGFESGIVRELSIFYAEGHYPDKTDAGEVIFGSGVWKSVPVPGLEGEYSPNKSLSYYVSVGFEGHKTLRVVARADPDNLFLLFPDPGILPKYAERTWRANATLIDDYEIQDDEIVRAPAADAVAAWEQMSIADLEALGSMNIVYLLNGTKPHSIAMGLRAISIGAPTVLYSVPEAYHVVNVEPSGHYWRYDIVSRNVPM
jgi:hypothetical protein